jgi:hypothetical protein
MNYIWIENKISYMSSKVSAVSSIADFIFLTNSSSGSCSGKVREAITLQAGANGHPYPRHSSSHDRRLLNTCEELAK